MQRQTATESVNVMAHVDKVQSAFSKITFCCQTFATMMSLQHGDSWLPDQKHQDEQIMTINSMNSHGYEKPKMATCFFPAPWKPLCFNFSILPLHYRAFKMSQIITRHWWGDLYKIAKNSHQQRVTGQVHNPAKITFVPRGLIPPPPGSLEHQWLDFTQMPLSDSCHCVLIILCMFSGWSEAFHCHKADAIMVSKKPLENVFLTGNLPESPVIKETISLNKSYKP